MGVSGGLPRLQILGDSAHGVLAGFNVAAIVMLTLASGIDVQAQSPPTPIHLVDTQGRPVAGAVVSTYFTRDLDRESSFTPSEELSLKSRTSNEQGEATLMLSLRNSRSVKAVFAIRPDKERPLVGIRKVTSEELGKPNTIVMHPACRVRLRVECPGFRELEEWYHAELGGPGWERGAYLLLGDQTTDPIPQFARSTTGELEFLVPPGRYTIIAFGTDTDRVVLAVEVQSGHRVRNLGLVAVNPSQAVQKGDFRNFWHLGRPDVDDPPNGDADGTGVRFRRAIRGSAPRTDATGVQDLAFSPDGKSLAIAHGYNDRPGEVKLWDIRTGSLVATLNAPDTKEAVPQLAFSPDGKSLAGSVGSMHNFELPSMIVLWDIADGGTPAGLARSYGVGHHDRVLARRQDPGLRRRGQDGAILGRRDRPRGRSVRDGREIRMAPGDRVRARWQDSGGRRAARSSRSGRSRATASRPRSSPTASGCSP